MSAAKVDLGRHLFYDTRLSSNGTYACATCHVQALGFTDGLVTAIGETGEVHRRNAMPLVNVAYDASFTWANPLVPDLEHQALVPMFGEHPIELGLASEAALVAVLATEPAYAEMFAAAFPDDGEALTLEHVVFAISSFERTIVSGGSAFDEWFYGTGYGELSDAAVRGWDIFTQPPANCFRCHGNFNFTDAAQYEGSPAPSPQFHNIGLYNTDGAGAYPAVDPGLIEITGLPEDMGKFKTPSLRNIAVTAPYMHDGSIATLEAVIDHYIAGGRVIDTGPNAGDGTTSPLRSEYVQGFALTPEQRDDLIALLESFTDDAFLADATLSDPWPR